MLDSEWTLAPAVEELFGAPAIHDGQLRMMFSCCHPRLPEEAQVALMLHILCGFSVDEVAGAFVSSHAAIEKRISRAKKVMAGSKRLFDVSGQGDLSVRLPAVQRALYLLFNEGYHGASPESAVRDRKSTRLNSSHGYISYAVFCLKKKKENSKKSRPANTSTRDIPMVTSG